MAIMVLAFTLSVNAATVSDLEADYTGKTIILSTNDVHGAIDGYQYAAGLKDELESRGATVFLVDCGDFSNGEVYVSESKGASAVELMNLSGYDFSTLGNHEFDFGPAALATNMESAGFGVLCSNFVAKETNTPVYSNGVVVDGGSDLKIGFIGLATPETLTKAMPTNFDVNTILKEESFTNAKAEAEELIADGADVVIAIAHLGVDDESEPYRSYDLLDVADNIDMVLDGHSHTVMESGEAGEPIMSTGTKFNNIGVTVLDDATEAIEDNFLLELKDSEGAYDTGLFSNAAVKARAEEIKDEVDDAYNVKVAESAVFLNGYKSSVEAEAAGLPNGNRDGETNLGNLITDAIKWYVVEENAIDLGVPAENVVTITNGGGIRANIEAGDVTKTDILKVLPFGNTIAAVTVKGSELLEALEASTYTQVVGGFPHIEGMNITLNRGLDYDANDTEYPGSTYFGPKTINRVRIDDVNGKAFDPDATYVVLTNNFCAAGGDTYYAFAAASSQFDTSITMDYAVQQYVLNKLGGVIGEDYANPKGRLTIKNDPLEKEREAAKTALDKIDISAIIDTAKAQKIISDAKAAVDSADSAEAITKLVDDAKAELAKLPTNLDKAKEAAKAELDKIDLSKVPEASKAQAQKVIADAKAAVDKADSAEAVNKIVSGAKAEVAKLAAVDEVGSAHDVAGSTFTVTDNSSADNLAVEFTKANNAKNANVPATVNINGREYKVTSVAAGAFEGKKIKNVTLGANVEKVAKGAFKKSKATKLTVKTKKLNKASVKGSLKGSKIKTVKVKVGNKKENKKFVKKYKKIFTKKNAGRKVKVK